MKDTTTATPHFQSAFNNWLEEHPAHNARQIAIEAGMEPSLLHAIANGTRSVTRQTLTRMLPIIARRSSILHALLLQIAALRDNTVPEYRAHLRVEPLDHPVDVTAQLDLYGRLAAQWADRARADADFWAMWSHLDAYMHHPEALTTAPPAPEPPAPIALYTTTPDPAPLKVAETPTPYQSSTSEG